MNGVIVTDMEMPKTCMKCKDFVTYSIYDGYCIKLKKHMHVTDSTKERCPDCPLKSIEGLIEKIESQTMISKKSVIGLIKEYCKE